MDEENQKLDEADDHSDEFKDQKPKSLIENFSCCCHFYTKTGFFIFGILLFIFWIYNKFT